MASKIIYLVVFLTTSLFIFPKSWTDSRVELFNYKSEPGGLVEQITIRFEWGREAYTYLEFRDVNESLQSVPPIFQILSILSIPNYALLDVRVDMKKGKIVKNQEIPITSHELFNDPNGFTAKQMTKNRTMTNQLTLQLFSFHWAKKENGIKKLSETPEHLRKFADSELVTVPTSFEVKPGAFIEIALFCHFVDFDNGVAKCYFKFIYPYKNDFDAVSNFIEPREEFPNIISGPPILLNGIPLSKGTLFCFLTQDLDGNGTKELIVGAGGRPNNRNLRYYNIYKFDKLVERIEKERAKGK